VEGRTARRWEAQHEGGEGNGDQERNGGAGEWRWSSRNPFSAAWLPLLRPPSAPDGKGRIPGGFFRGFCVNL
jgi:hypothetical protein